MINRIIMKLYDEYDKGNIEPLIEFSKKTLPNDGTDKLFVGCTLIMFSRSNCSREELLDIVKSAKKKVGNTNLLKFYLDRINTVKGINKYFEDKDFDKHIDLIIEYLEQFKPRFISDLKKQNKKIEDYLNK